MLQLLLGALCISTAPLFVKAVTVGPTMTGVYRCGVAALVLALIAFTQSKRTGKSSISRSPAERKLMLWSIFIAGAFFALDLTFWHQSVIYIGAGLATILGNTQAFYLALFGIVLAGERPTRRFMVALPLAVAGILLLVGVDTTTADPANYMAGVIFGLLTGLMYAGYLISLRRTERTTQGLSPAARLASIMAITAVLMIPIAGIEGQLALPDARSAVLLAGLAVGVQVGGWLLITSGLAKVPISRAGLILLLQPALASVWGALLFDEPFGPIRIAGAALTLTAIYLGSTARR